MALKKHKSKHAKKTEVLIRENTRVSHEDYYAANEDQPPEKEEAATAAGGHLPRYLGRILIILLLAVLVLVLWLNRDNFSPDNFTTWFKTKLMGTGAGDGYPVTITGSNADSQNFLDYEGNSVILSDTALTVLNGTGRELLSYRHSYSSPAISAAQGRFLLYNIGGTGYSMVSVGAETQKKTAADKLSTAAIAKNGRYALVTQPSDYASRLSVYLPDGKLKFTYQFADAYISALALNDDASGGVAAAVQSENGQLYSKLYVFDFNSENPVNEFFTADNMVIKLGYTGRGSFCAVGDKKAVFFDDGQKFTELGYEGKNLTAIKIENDVALISISSYAKSGACTVLVYKDSAQPLQVHTEEYVTALSAYGNVFAALTGGGATAYDLQSGTVLGLGPTGHDAKGISLVNERDLYVLGVREVRYLTLQPPQASPQPGQASPKTPSTPAAQPSPTPKATEKPKKPIPAG